MVKEVRYTSIRRVIDNLSEHPMLSDLTLEQVVRHALRFISINGFPELYEDKICQVEIESYRGLLPCDLISIRQVKDCKTGRCLRSMTDNFTPGLREEFSKHRKQEPDANGEIKPLNHIPARILYNEPTFKTQNRVIFTSFPEGTVEIAYQAIPVDDDGFPLLLDNEVYLAALEAYIKKQIFTIKFDQQKISAGVLENAKKDYAWLAGQLNSEMRIPSISEMESISRFTTSLIPRMREFDSGFKNLGNREYIYKH